MPTRLDATAGYVWDVSGGAPPGPLRPAERDHLRRLAAQVAEIAAHPKQEARRELWYRHNRLERVRPLVLVFPEDSWGEILGEDQLTVEDPFWRQWEWHLRHLVYRDQGMVDDFVVEPDLYVRRVVRSSGWGMSPRYVRPRFEKGSYVWEAPLQDERDLDRLHLPEVEVDEAATERAREATEEALGDLLRVRVHGALPHANLIGEATALRGLQQVLLDMHDRPAWLHRLMRRLSDGLMRGVERLERGGHLTLNNRGHYNDSGGIGFSDELPAVGYAGRARLADLWGFGVAQELAGVGPSQHEEFVLQYQLPLLERCGLNAYGCCEPYDHKYDMLFRRVPRLRRVSISPWCDLAQAAAALEDRCIFSWKPNPAMVSTLFDPRQVRAYVRRALEQTRGCVVEIIHKDTFTVCHEPDRLEAWTRIAAEEVERSAP
jgi:hypothetical protein